jgi:hypothetical protein
VLDIVDCSTLLQAYERLAEDHSPCDSAGDCMIVAGHCAVGLGECWYARSPIDVTQYATRVETIVARWHALDCASEAEACECPSDPVAMCIEDASPGPQCGL